MHGLLTLLLEDNIYVSQETSNVILPCNLTICNVAPEYKQDKSQINWIVWPLKSTIMVNFQGLKTAHRLRGLSAHSTPTRCTLKSQRKLWRLEATLTTWPSARSSPRPTSPFPLPTRRHPLLGPNSSPLPSARTIWMPQGKKLKKLTHPSSCNKPNPSETGGTRLAVSWGTTISHATSSTLEWPSMRRSWPRPF